jgi:copper chaperone CopZ
MIQKTLVKGSKNLPRAEARAILSCVSAKGHVSGRVEKQLRKTEGVREVTINPLTHNITIGYDPNKLTVKEIRSILKRLHSIVPST